MLHACPFYSASAIISAGEKPTGYFLFEFPRLFGKIFELLIPNFYKIHEPGRFP